MVQGPGRKMERLHGQHWCNGHFQRRAPGHVAGYAAPRFTLRVAVFLEIGATELDGALGCVILVSPVIDPLGRYQYAKGLRDDCTPPAGMSERVAPMHDLYWVTEEAMAEAAPARILAGGERTELPPTLCLARTYEEAHPRPDLDEFIRQYPKAGGQIDVTILEGEGEGVLLDLSLPVAKQALQQMTSFIHQHIG